MSTAQGVSRGFHWLGLVLAGAFFISVVGMLGSQARADNLLFDGNQLYEWCRGSGADEDEGLKEDEGLRMVSRGLCTGYIGGVADTLANAGTYTCLEKGTKLEQLIDLVKGYLTDHPDSRDWPAASVVKTAIMEKSPCPQG